MKTTRFALLGLAALGLIALLGPGCKPDAATNPPTIEFYDGTAAGATKVTEVKGDFYVFVTVDAATSLQSLTWKHVDGDVSSQGELKTSKDKTSERQVAQFLVKELKTQKGTITFTATDKTGTAREASLTVNMGAPVQVKVSVGKIYHAEGTRPGSFDFLKGANCDPKEGQIRNANTGNDGFKNPGFKAMNGAKVYEVPQAKDLPTVTREELDAIVKAGGDKASVVVKDLAQYVVAIPSGELVLMRIDKIDPADKDTGGKGNDGSIAFSYVIK